MLSTSRPASSVITIFSKFVFEMLVGIFKKCQKFTYNSFYNFPQVTKMKCKKLDHNFSAFSGGWGSSGVSHSRGDSIYRWIQSQSSARGSINDIDYQQFLDALIPKSWHININPLSGAAATSPACHQNGQKFNIKDTLENWLAFYINLLDKVDILTETSYKFVVFGTAAKNLKEYRLWNTTFHTTAPHRIEVLYCKNFQNHSQATAYEYVLSWVFFLYVQIKSWYVLIIEYNTQNIPQNEWRMEMWMVHCDLSCCAILLMYSGFTNYLHFYLDFRTLCSFKQILDTPASSHPN